MSRTGIVAGAIVLLWAVIAIIGPWLMPHDPGEIVDFDYFGPISGALWFGSDYLGRDMVSRILMGARYTVGISLAAVCLACAGGAQLGMTAAVTGGRFDAILSRRLDALNSIPSKLFGLVLVAAVRSSLLAVGRGADLPDAVHTSRISITRRGDGGFTLAVSGAARVDPTPQQIRNWSSFLPMFFKRRKSLAPGGLQAWKARHETLAHWRLDRPTPMERMRVLDPRPDMGQVRLTLARAREAFPGFGRGADDCGPRGLYRQHSGRRPGNRPNRGAGPVPCGGIQRPRLRHRPRRRPSDRRPDHRAGADRRSEAL